MTLKEQEVLNKFYKKRCDLTHDFDVTLRNQPALKDDYHQYYELICNLFLKIIKHTSD